MNVIRVDDPDDPRVAPYRAIRERDLAGRLGRFVAEGKVVLNVMFSARRFAAESALVLEGRLPGLSETLALAPASLPVYAASQQVMDEIAGFHVHRGILAIGVRRPPESADELIRAMPARALVLVLVGISNHDNVGAIFRNAAAFGAEAVLIDASCCDPLYRKAIRVSVGATLKVPFAVAGDAPELPALLSAHGFRLLALSPSGAMDIRECFRPDRLALFFGSEGEGLPGKLMSRLASVRIAMAPGFDSLNVAAASAIALHRLAGI